MTGVCQWSEDGVAILPDQPDDAAPQSLARLFFYVNVLRRDIVRDHGKIIVHFDPQPQPIQRPSLLPAARLGLVLHRDDDPCRYIAVLFELFVMPDRFQIGIFQDLIKFVPQDRVLCDQVGERPICVHIGRLIDMDEPPLPIVHRQSPSMGFIIPPFHFRDPSDIALSAHVPRDLERPATRA